MRKIWSFLLVLFMIICPLLSIEVEAGNTGAPTRVINVVYDDSGSMIQMSGEKYDTWCQAKYSMEVFASMLGEKDTMNIYVMSDYMSGTSAPPKLTLSGTDGAANNVSRVHDMLTKAQDTPFRSVEKAYSDLKNATADEKWLVVLTDGEFDEFINDSDGGKSAIDKFFAGKSNDIKVMFFAMGAKAAAITENNAQNIYFEKAKSNNEILNKITGICTRIFNSHCLDVNSSDKKFDFDVPMSQLIVFAQGEGVKINGLENGKGKNIKSSGNVSVRYSEKAATNPSYQDPKIATNLVGEVAIFNGDFDSGKYTVNVSNAETIEVYYKPNVAIAVYLKNENGEEVTNIEDLESGDYTIEFGFIRTGSNEIVQESKLLGDVKYEAVITNNGTKHEKTYTSGDKIHLEEGELLIDATASFLDYNTVSTMLDYTIYKNKGIEFTAETEPQYLISKEGITDTPTEIKLTLDGNAFTKEQWESFEVPEVVLGKRLPEEDPDFWKILNFIRKFRPVSDVKVEKSQEPGKLYLYPTLEDNKVKNGTYVGSEYSISVYSQDGKAVWEGDFNGQLRVKDTRSFMDREWDVIIKLAFLLVLLFILLGYTPLFKKRFPKSMKGTPTIECKPIPFGRTDTSLGRFSKDPMSTFVPYVPETGTLTFVPFGTVGIPSMKLKAAGGSKMIIVNTASFAGNRQISIDGESISEDQQKQISKTPSMTIEVKTQQMKYTCTPRM